ncbi:MAG: polymerase sigma-70 factor, subfamily [Actinomycetota bacterium]|nr:polymerase sigma-70 factor, subfamily [Actinomycetota bacterium]
MNLVGANDRLPSEAGLADAEPGDWVEALSIPGARQDHAMSKLHQMMLRASHHQVRRMRSSLAGVGNDRLEEIANQAADEAMMAVLARLHTFEGRSRFTTWAYKFAILQSATEVRRFAWLNREVELNDGTQISQVTEHGPSPAGYAEAADLSSAVSRAIELALTPHQRRVTIALLVDDVPIDVLAQRLGTNRNALYKTVHDARTRLRAHLIASGHLPPPQPEQLEGTS